jgi:hypothetical protein
MALLLGTLAVVTLAGLAFAVRRRTLRAARQLEPGRVVIASNLAGTRRAR